MKQVKYYDFDIELSAEKRWGPIIDDFADYLPKLKEHIESIINTFGSTTINFTRPFYHMIPKSKILHFDELSYISERIGLDMFDILLMQLIYEASSACTSAVIKVNGRDFFIRTMDWPMLFLKDITIGLNISRGPLKIGRVVTWLGYVGFLTATNLIDNYIISINYRRTEELTTSSLIKNFYRVISLKWPIGYLIRDIIEKSYHPTNTLDILTNTDIVTPCYITMHTPNTSTVIITRDCDKAVNIRTKNLIQTNCDWDKITPNILWSVERIAHVRNVEQKISKTDAITVNNVLAELLTHPVYNDETIYVYYQFDRESGTMV